MQQNELDQLMHDSANNAVHVAEEEFGVTLDFSADSISVVDDILLSFIERYHDQALQDNAVFTLCNIYGAYVGEVYRLLAGGEWRYDTSNKNAPYVILEVGDRTYAFAGICYERLVNDSRTSVKAYFDQALNHQKH
jgi:hypothetical protein